MDATTDGYDCTPETLLRAKARECAELRELLTLVAQDLERLACEYPGLAGALPGSGDAPAAAALERLRHSATARLTDAEYEALLDLAGEKPLGVFLRELLRRQIARRKH